MLAILVNINKNESACKHKYQINRIQEKFSKH